MCVRSATSRQRLTACLREAVRSVTEIRGHSFLVFWPAAAQFLFILSCAVLRSASAKTAHEKDWFLARRRRNNGLGKATAYVLSASDVCDHDAAIIRAAALVGQGQQTRACRGWLGLPQRDLGKLVVAHILD
jgi:hypothetical protein